MSTSKFDIGGNAIVYTYPTGEYDIVCASDHWYTPPGWEKAEDFSHPARAGGARPCEVIPEEQMEFPLDNESLPKPREKGKKSQGEDMLRSMRRARAKVRRLALANEFSYFVTLTLSPEMVDRYDSAAIMKKVNVWLGNMVKRKGLRYVLVPERHKDGAFHFHGFFAGPGLEAVPSGHNDSQGHEIFNLPQWGFGFTAAIGLYGTYSQAVGYVCKYIGKQGGERPMGRWYYSGGDLMEPQKDYTVMDYRQLAEDYAGEAVELDIPGSKLLVVHHRNM